MYPKKNKRKNDVEEYDDRKMLNRIIRRIEKFISEYKLYFAIIIIVFIFLYSINIGGIKDSIQNFFSKINEDLSYILFQTYFIRGVIEGVMAYVAYVASKRTRSDMIKKTTQIIFFVLLLLAVYDIYPAIKHLFGG